MGGARAVAAVTLCFATLSATALAADIPVPAKRLKIVDRGNDKDRVSFIVRDNTAGITKGAGTDANDISAILHISYGTNDTGALFSVPVGAYDGTDGWRANDGRRARFVNRTSPAGSTTAWRTKIARRYIRFRSKALGDDVVLDIVSAGPPVGSVFTAYCIDNAGEWNCHCSEFQSCNYKLIFDGTGARLDCRQSSIGDPTCRGLQPTTLVASTSFDVDFVADCENAP